MREFIRKPEPPPCLPVGAIFGKKTTPGEVGLEIEVEGSYLLYEESTPTPWVYHEDPSLRGAENAEYVLGKPLPFLEIPGAVNGLFNALKENKAKFDDSNRTSVHVHLNCQGFHVNRLAAFMGMWYAVEEVLVAWCGEFREGNLFCLRGIDAPAVVTQMKRFIRNDCAYTISDYYRYAALNPHALTKYGSLEIRTLRGCPDPETIIEWVSILERLYEASKGFRDPREVVAMFSSGGPLTYYKRLLGVKADTVQSAIGWSNDQIKESMFRGIRLAQEICYCRDWDLFKVMKIGPDPFGRDENKIAPKIIAESSTPVPTPEPAGVDPGLYASAMQSFMHEYQAQILAQQPEPTMPDWAVDLNL